MSDRRRSVVALALASLARWTGVRTRAAGGRCGRGETRRDGDDPAGRVPVGDGAAARGSRLLAMLPGMRPRAPRRNVLVGFLYALLAGLVLLAVLSGGAQSPP